MENKISKRKNLRIPQYNYSDVGLYFITICTKERKNILSKIMHNKENESTILELLHYGRIIEKYIKSINKIYNDVKIEDYVIMPNHIHFICSVTETNLNRINNPANNKVPALVSTLKRLVNKDCSAKIWQRNYYEHIIRNEKEYIEILEYIQNNPYKWEHDTYFN